jgi:hypothetical protein
MSFSRRRSFLLRTQVPAVYWKLCHFEYKYVSRFTVSTEKVANKTKS